MKNLPILFVLLLMSACSGTKTIIEDSTERTSKAPIKFKDSIPFLREVIYVNAPDLSNISETDEIQHEDFKQTLTKSIITQHELWNGLLKKHVSNKGQVNYKEFKKHHKNLLEYISVLQLLQPSEKDSKADILAYWINAYNALTIDLILRNYPLKSIKDIKDPWDQHLWKLGKKWYSLNDIEHQILRNMDEPRIHFAIVCASVSCPKLLNEAYTSKDLDVQLTKATKDFLADNTKNSISTDKLELSKIFQWFAKDFKQNGDLIDFLNLYTDIKISNKAKTSFKDYNWDLNE